MFETIYLFFFFHSVINFFIEIENGGFLIAYWYLDIWTNINPAYACFCIFLINWPSTNE